MIDPVLHWSMIKRDLKLAHREAHDRVLEKHGITDKELDNLENEARIAMGDCKMLSNEYGLVQVIPDKPIQYGQHRLNKTGEINEYFKPKLHFTLKEKV